jgi:formylglycine-generating enzyme required for sulfatase activity
LGRFCFGDDPKFLPAFARCNGEVTNYHTTGEFLPNFYGLQDMHGGLWELTETRYPDELIGDSAPLDSRYWVIRGGAYYSPAVRCRSAQRNFSPEDIPFQYLGLRLVVELMEP